MGTDNRKQRERHEAMVGLVSAEAELLRSMDWIPLAPVAEIPGASIMWRSPDNKTYRQDEAVSLAKMRWVQLYER